MQQLEETANPINSEDLRAFADALYSGDFSARLPAREGDDAATEATNLLNYMAQRMQTMTAELTRLSNELHDGIFGGQAEFVVNMRRGPWRDSIEAFNEMEWALTGQVRDIAKAARRLAAGRTDHPVTAECRGEMLDLKNSINTLIDLLKTKKQPSGATA